MLLPHFVQFAANSFAGRPKRHQQVLKGTKYAGIKVGERCKPCFQPLFDRMPAFSKQTPPQPGQTIMLPNDHTTDFFKLLKNAFDPSGTNHAAR